MGPVESAVRARVHSGQTLQLTSSRRPFGIGRLDRNGIELLLGTQQNPVKLPWEVFERIPAFVGANRDREGWVRAGGTYKVDAEHGTLDEILKEYTGTSTSRWVASVLDVAGVVETRRNPVRVRLIRTADD